jgi:hypothetical protein
MYVEDERLEIEDCFLEVLLEVASGELDHHLDAVLAEVLKEIGPIVLLPLDLLV